MGHLRGFAKGNLHFGSLWAAFWSAVPLYSVRQPVPFSREETNQLQRLTSKRHGSVFGSSLKIVMGEQHGSSEISQSRLPLPMVLKSWNSPVQAFRHGMSRSCLKGICRSILMTTNISIAWLTSARFACLASFPANKKQRMCDLLAALSWTITCFVVDIKTICR